MHDERKLQSHLNKNKKIKKTEDLSKCLKRSAIANTWKIVERNHANGYYIPFVCDSIYASKGIKITWKSCFRLCKKSNCLLKCRFGNGNDANAI